MAVAFVQNHTGGTSVTTDTAVACALAANVAAGNLLVAFFAFDNLTTTTPTVSSIAKPAGETASWVKIGSFDSPISTVSAGVRGELWAIVTTTTWTAGTDNANMTLSGSRVAKVALLTEFSGTTVTLRNACGSGTGTTSASPASASTGTLVVGDLVVGAQGVETDAASTPMGGAWQNGTYQVSTAAGGSALNNITALLQYQIAASTSSLTYNPTPGSNTDSGALAAAFTPAVSASAGIWGSIPI